MVLNRWVVVLVCMLELRWKGGFNSIMLMFVFVIFDVVLLCVIVIWLMILFVVIVVCVDVIVVVE